MPSNNSIQIGALVPLSRPGWLEAGQHLLAGLELAARDINSSGGIAGRPLALLVRDTAANPDKAAAAVAELAQLGVVAIAGEYHSVVARAVAAQADALRIPFLCSSAVLDALTDHPTDWVARIAPAQSRGWRIYADYLASAGHARIAVAVQPSIYWESGIRILRDRLAPHGGTILELDMRKFSLADQSEAPYEALCNELAANNATALLLLVGQPDPAVSIIKSVRRDSRLATILIGAPAGQPELSTWPSLLGNDAAAIPFLRYMPDTLTPLGTRVEAALHTQLAEAPSFVAFEGYDTILVLAAILTKLSALPQSQPLNSSSLITPLSSLISDSRSLISKSWPQISLEGTRSQIRFSRTPDIAVWQWTWPPIQIADRDPANPTRFRILYSADDFDQQ